MKRLLFGLPCLALCLLAGPTSGEAAPRPKRPDYDKLFRFLDANKDGKISREELRKLATVAPRLKGDKALADKLFDRLDTDKDGFLSPAELKKLRELRGGRPAKESPPQKNAEAQTARKTRYPKPPSSKNVAIVPAA
jgi:hypothetical protein